MATKAEAAPKITELSIFVSTDMKANIGNYESVGLSSSRSEKWGVEGLSLEEVDALYQERYEAIKVEVGDIAVERYKAAKEGEV